MSTASVVFSWPWRYSWRSRAGGLIVTGRNFRGVLGRGFTQSDNARLARAPAIYFRAMGTMVLCVGLIMGFLGAVSLMPSDVDRAASAILFTLAGLLFAVLVVSLIWSLVLAGRHRLFRWNKP